ncbi:N-chimaerin-like [Ambystoma mexicanum]|uniref:N-chimaerin-like n=1 Tax=Ambystoma mexicanum TaxID=8296 RepID=UPI0037E7B197
MPSEESCPQGQNEPCGTRRTLDIGRVPALLATLLRVQTGGQSGQGGLWKPLKLLACAELHPLLRKPSTQEEEEKEECMVNHKPHNFQVHTFRAPHWCKFCANIIWCKAGQGQKCADCGLRVHTQCVRLTRRDCRPPLTLTQTVFGCDLTTLVKAQDTLRPLVVETCIQEIEARGLKCEGLYRVSGSSDRIEVLRTAFNSDAAIGAQSAQSCEDVHALAGALKLYLRELPIPLIPYSLYQRAIDAARRPVLEEQVILLCAMLRHLPPAHYATLRFLIAHLRRVSDHEAENLMSAANLGIVFGPTLMRPLSQDPLVILSNISYQRLVVHLLIEHQAVFF